MSERKCRACGCTQHNACVTEEGPCHWVGWDLCSACKVILEDKPTAKAIAKLQEACNLAGVGSPTVNAKMGRYQVALGEDWFFDVLVNSESSKEGFWLELWDPEDEAIAEGSNFFTPGDTANTVAEHIRSVQEQYVQEEVENA